jgi:hypothetical protein
MSFATEMDMRSGELLGLSWPIRTSRRPLHVHVIGSDGQARIALGDAGRCPFLLTNEGLSRRQVAMMLDEIEQNRARLLQRWREIHGDA